MKNLSYSLALCAAIATPCKSHALGGALIDGTKTFASRLCYNALYRPIMLPLIVGRKHARSLAQTCSRLLWQEENSLANNAVPDEEDPIELQRVQLRNALHESFAVIPERHPGPIVISVNLNENMSHNRFIGTQPTPANNNRTASEHVTTVTPSLYDRTITWIKEHKIKSCFYGFCVGYAGIHSYLLYLSWILGSESCWSRWKNQCSLEELFRVKQSDLVKDLLQTIELKDAGNAQNNSIMRITRFIQEADDEIDYLKRYQQIVNLLERTGLRRICFYSGLYPAEALDRLRRLQFIKNSAYGWLNDLRNQQSYSAMFSSAGK